MAANVAHKEDVNGNIRPDKGKSAEKIDGIDQILSYNDISLNLYFKTLQPLEFTEDVVTPMDMETREEETGVKLSSQEPSDDHLDAMFAELEVLGEVVDEDKRIVIGLALIPEKDIYRRNGDYEYNIRFSKETVRKASELYLKKMKIHNSTLEHEKKTEGRH